MDLLKFGFRNRKIRELALYLGYRVTKDIACFDLPAGYTCPKADICKTFANKQTGHLTRVGRVLCYASKAEAIYPPTRNMRWHNFDLLKNSENMVELINNSLPVGVKIVRLHSSGDFFSKEYFMAWVDVAKQNPEIVFFGYTKILEYTAIELPENFKIVYSYGSTDDETYNTLENKPAACFIAEKENTFALPVVCAGKNSGYEDFFKILKQESFVINVH